jgi:hypothetical protein
VRDPDDAPHGIRVAVVVDRHGKIISKRSEESAYLFGVLVEWWE